MAKAVYNTKSHQALARLYRGRPCWWCGKPASTVDHLIPVASGLPAAILNTPWNTRPACHQCNGRRGAHLRNQKAAQRLSAQNSWTNPNW